ncbi:MAG: AAA family ATPase [Bacteroidales bacterium]|nr:AAA family ATPase [Bacteroidales bacterium]
MEKSIFYYINIEKIIIFAQENRHVMIQELRFKNFLSFRDEAIFSFEPTRDEPINRVAVMKDGAKLLRFAVVFGANASGKSNFLEALDFLRRFWTQVPTRNDLSTRVVPFLLDKDTPSEDTSFELKFYVSDVRYWYKLSLNKERVSGESLYFYNDSVQPTRIFWREYHDGQSVVKFNPAAVKLKAAEIDAINLNCWKNMSFFASMTKVNMTVERVSDVIRWINDKLMPGINRSTELSGYAKEKMLKDEEFRDYLTSFIKTADLRIAEVNVKEITHALNEQQLKMVSDAPFIDEEQKAEILSRGSISNIDTGFKVRVKNVRGEEEYILPENRQSDGTTRVIEIESAIYTTIKEEAFLHVDEIEASLHPSLLDFVLNEFLKVNDNNRSQLLVTTHYDPLLDSLDVNDLFGKDSVWFTEKKEDGNTELYPLTDFKGLGRLSSIRKSYKNGQFGAVPEIYI